MRSKLKAICGEKREFKALIARVVNHAEKPSKKIVLLQRVALASGTGCGTEMTDHLWLPYNGELKKFKPGSSIVFKAKVSGYRKGYAGNPVHAKDYELTGIHNVRQLEKAKV